MIGNLARTGARARRDPLARRGARRRACLDPPDAVRAGRVGLGGRSTPARADGSVARRRPSRRERDDHDRSARSRAAPDRWETEAPRPGLTPGRPARLPVEPARRRPRARQSRRRQHLAEGRDGRPRRPGGRDALGQGLGHRPRHDHGRGLPGAPPRRALPLRAREAMEDAEMVAYLVRCGPLARPAAAVDRDAAARVRARGARRPHAPGRGDRAHVHARTGAGSRRRRSATRRSGSTTSGPGFDMSKRIAELLEENPRARAVLLAKHGLVTWGETSEEESYRATLEFVGRAAARSRAPAPAASGSAARRCGRCGTTPRASSPRRSRSRGAAARRRRGVVLEVDRSPEAVAFASSVRAPEVSQIGAPCPDHLINTKHKPLVVDFDPETGSAEELAERLRAGVERVLRLVPRLLRASLDRREPPVPDRPGRPARRPPAGPRGRHERRRRGQARFSRELYERAIAVEDAPTPRAASAR